MKKYLFTFIFLYVLTLIILLCGCTDGAIKSTERIPSISLPSPTSEPISKETEAPSHHEHIFEAITISKPKCTENGLIQQRCIICGVTTESQVVDAIGHCYENGQCVFCGNHCNSLIPFDDAHE